MAGERIKTQEDLEREKQRLCTESWTMNWINDAAVKTEKKLVKVFLSGFRWCCLILITLLKIFYFDKIHYIYMIHIIHYVFVICIIQIHIICILYIDIDTLTINYAGQPFWLCAKIRRMSLESFHQTGWNLRLLGISTRRLSQESHGNYGISNIQYVLQYVID